MLTNDRPGTTDNHKSSTLKTLSSGELKHRDMFNLLLSILLKAHMNTYEIYLHVQGVKLIRICCVLLYCMGGRCKNTQPMIWEADAKKKPTTVMLVVVKLKVKLLQFWMNIQDNEWCKLKIELPLCFCANFHLFSWRINVSTTNEKFKAFILNHCSDNNTNQTHQQFSFKITQDVTTVFCLSPSQLSTFDLACSVLLNTYFKNHF